MAAAAVGVHLNSGSSVTPGRGVVERVRGANETDIAEWL